MSDDSFIREVDEELRSDRMQAIWKQFGKYIIGIAVLIVVGTAGYRGWDYYSQQQAARSGDTFIEAVALSEEGKHDEAIALLKKLEVEGTGQYPVLSNFRLAAEMAAKGDTEAAIAAYDEIAASGSTDETLRDIAKLRAGLLLVDEGPQETVIQRLEPLAKAGETFRHLAREGLGLAAWKANDYQAAFDQFSAINEDAGAPAGVRRRAAIMLELLAGKGFKAGSS